jgi:hypothetical protein
MRVGLYGLIFHALVVVAALGVAKSNRVPVDAGFWALAGACLVVAAFGVYALLVARYVANRADRRSVAITDMAIGMVAEPAIAIVATVLFSLVSAAPALGDGGSAFAAAVARHVYVGLLWVAANFTTQILVLGNAAGFAGFFLLKRGTAGAARKA